MSTVWYYNHFGFDYAYCSFASVHHGKFNSVFVLGVINYEGFSPIFKIILLNLFN